ncbi:MAG TPA: hypothetical protein VFJ59_12540 [Pseudolabrys sp.]|nr:hypothetical protein [Pseudolabrys sp.]
MTVSRDARSRYSQKADNPAAPAFATLYQSYHLPGQFTPGAYGSSRLYGRIAEPEFAEPLDSAARDCDLTALFVSDIRLALKLGPDIASNSPAAIATT